MKRIVVILMLLCTLSGPMAGCYMPPSEGLTPEEAEMVRAKQEYFMLGAAAVFAVGVLIMFGVAHSGE